MLFFAKNHLPTQNLLSHAKSWEDVVEGVVGGEVAEYFGEGVDAGMEVEGDDVGGGGVVELADDSLDGLLGRE